MANAEATQAKRRKERQRARAARAAEANGSPSKNGKNDGRPPKGKTREWVDAIVFAVVVMVIVRTLFFDLFRIPTPSMEKNLLVGDYLFVSKLHYGTRLPMGICVPFTDACVPGIRFPYIRLPGFTDVDRGDAVVFNWPADPEDKNVDRRMHYIKRVVGLPGETLAVRNKVVHVDGEPLPFGEGMQQRWDVFTNEAGLRLPESRLRELGVTDVGGTNDPRRVHITATREAAEAIAAWPYVERVEPSIVPSAAVYSTSLYPADQGYTADNYGPVQIPEKGQTVTLSPQTWALYETVISRYEGHTTQAQPGGGYTIEGQPATTYTFEQDYYFVMGDNRDNSEDSRFWGFVPMDHVVGKAIMVYFSWSPGDGPPRISRMFTPIGDDGLNAGTAAE
ncbi:MAG: signal peptidase I [Rhodothermales bacterium]